MPTQLSKQLRIGACTVDLNLQRLYRDGAIFQVTPRAMSVLTALLQNPGVPLSRDALILQVWGTPHVTNDVVTKAIKELRKHFGERDDIAGNKSAGKFDVANGDKQIYIETLPKIGYRLIAPVSAMPILIAEGTRVDATEVGMLTGEQSKFTATEMCATEIAAVGRLDGTPSGAAAMVPRADSSSKPSTTALWTFGVAVSLAVAFWLITSDRKDETLAPAEPSALLIEPLRAQLLLNLKPLLAGSAQEGSPTLSPDGKWLAYTRLETTDTGPVVMVRGVNDINARRVSSVAAQAELNPRWSRDGQQIAFLRFSEHGCDLVLAPLVAGAERVVTHCETTRQEFYEFTPDGQGMLLFRTDATSNGRAVMQRLTFADGVLRSLNYPRSATQEDVQAHYAPDKRQLLLRRGLLPNSHLYLRVGENNALQRMTHIDARIRGFTWLADSRHVVLSSDHSGIPELWLLDTATQKLARLGSANAQFPDLNLATGRLIFERSEQITRLQSLRMQAAQRKTPSAVQSADDIPWRSQFPSARSESFPVLDPQGRTLAFISDRSGESALYFASIASENPIGTSPPELRGGIRVNTARLAFSPDGKTVLATRRNDSANILLEIDPESLAQRPLVAQFDVRHACFLDAQNIVFEGRKIADTSPMQLWLLAANTAPQVLTTGGGIRPWCVAGQLYFLRPPELNLYQMELSANATRQISTRIAGWNQAAWTVTERAVYYLDNPENAAPGLYRFDLGTRSVALMVPWKNELNASGIAVEETSRSVIMGMISGADSDVMQVPEFVK